VFGQRTQLWWELPVIESFNLIKSIYRIPALTFKENIDRFDALVGVSKLFHQPVKNLSLGQRMLCDITASFLHNPSIIFLDEPTIGLDVTIKSQIRKLIVSLNQEKNTTILLTTHDVGDIEALCRRLVLIDKGRTIYDGPIEKFNKIFGSIRTLKVLPHENDGPGFEKKLSVALQKFSGTTIAVETKNSWHSIIIDQEINSVAEVISQLILQLPVRDLQIQDIGTEEVIARVYSGDLQ
jgi:ABC-2 type transport system ATP-binding protein